MIWSSSSAMMLMNKVQNRVGGKIEMLVADWSDTWLQREKRLHTVHSELKTVGKWNFSEKSNH